MMFYSIIASFCLLGIARSQTISGLTACLTKEQNLQMECNFTPLKDKGAATCMYEVDKKVVATTGETPVDPTFKNRGTVNIDKNVCKLTLTGFADEQEKKYNCTISQKEAAASAVINVQKKTLKTCSAGNNLKQGGVVLLLAFVLPLLSGML